MTERREDAQPEPGDVTPAAQGEAPVDAAAEAPEHAAVAAPEHAAGQATVRTQAEAPVDTTGETTPVVDARVDDAAEVTPDLGGPTEQGPPTAEPTADDLAHARPARVRHAPRFGRFIGTAVAVGLLIGLVLAIVIPAPRGVGFVLAWAYLGLPIAFVLGLATGVVAVVLDRRS